MDEQRQSNPNAKYSRQQLQNNGYEGNPTYQNNLHMPEQPKQWNYPGMNGYAKQENQGNVSTGANKTENLNNQVFTDNTNKAYTSKSPYQNMQAVSGKKQYDGSQYNPNQYRNNPNTTYQPNQYQSNTYFQNNSQTAVSQEMNAAKEANRQSVPVKQTNEMRQEQNEERTDALEKQTVAEIAATQEGKKETAPNVAAKPEKTASQFANGGYQFNPQAAKETEPAYSNSAYQQNTFSKNGFSQPQEGQPKNMNAQNSYQYTGYQNTNYQSNGSSNGAYQNNSYENNGYQNNSYQNNGYQNNMYANGQNPNAAYQQNGYNGMQNQQYGANGYNTAYMMNNQKSKKPVIIASVIGGIAVLSILIILLINIFGGSNSPKGVLNKFESAMLNNDIEKLMDCCDEDLQEKFEYYKLWYGSDWQEDFFGDTDYEEMEIIEEDGEDDIYEYRCKLLSEDGDYDYVIVNMEKNSDGKWKIVNIR